MKTFTIPVFFLLFSTIYSQSCEICKLALTTPDIYEFESYKDIVENYSKVINSSNSQKKNRKYGFNIPTSYGVLGLEKQKSRGILTKLYSNENYSLDLEERKWISTIMNNPLAYQSFDRCIERCMNGNTTYYSTRVDKKDFSKFTLKIIPISPGKTEIKIAQFIPENCKIVGGTFLSNELELKTSNSHTVIFEKTNINEEAKVTVSFYFQPNSDIDVVIPTKQEEPPCQVDYQFHTKEMGGGLGGEEFYFKPQEENYQNISKIKSIYIQYGTYVDAIDIKWVTNDGREIRTSQKAGGSSGGAALIEFEPDEEIIKIAANHGIFIDALTIWTNKDKYGPYGGKSGGYDEFPIPENSQLISFYGRAGNFIDKLGLKYRTVNYKCPN